MATTTNYGWDTPDDTDLVKDGAAAIRTLGSSIDTTTKNLNPQTTTGALAYRSATSNVNTALPIGTAGQVLAVNSGATAPEWITNPSGLPTAVFCDQKAQNTQGGTFTSAAWRTRDINTTVGNNGITGASIASNQITLPAGTYLIQGSAPAYDVNQHITRFYNITDSAVAINGGASYVDALDTVVTHSFFSGVVTITATKVFEVQHQAAATSATSGFGIASLLAAEVYTQITIMKVG